MGTSYICAASVMPRITSDVDSRGPTTVLTMPRGTPPIAATSLTFANIAAMPAP